MLQAQVLEVLNTPGDEMTVEELDQLLLTGEIPFERHGQAIDLIDKLPDLLVLELIDFTSQQHSIDSAVIWENLYALARLFQSPRAPFIKPMTPSRLETLKGLQETISRYDVVLKQLSD